MVNFPLVSEAVTQLQNQAFTCSFQRYRRSLLKYLNNFWFFLIEIESWFPHFKSKYLLYLELKAVISHH